MESWQVIGHFTAPIFVTTTSLFKKYIRARILSEEYIRAIILSKKYIRMRIFKIYVYNVFYEFYEFKHKLK